MSKLLVGKKTVVTGGTRGIGLAIAKRFKEEGADVLITGTKLQFNQNFGFDYQMVDLSVSQSVLEFIHILQKYAPDILVNNAGINIINPPNPLVCDIEVSEFLRVQQVNVTAPLQLCQAVIPGMRQKEWGRIINIASIWSKNSKAGRAAYSASKFALDGITVALAAEVAQYGILVNCVSPGFIETDLTRKMLGEEGINEMVKQVPLKRLGQSEEIAAFVAWLSSPENTFITAQNLIIDGGFSRVRI